ncbi:TPA: hypothetical protein EYP13_05295, partial [Candidatus Micrarchaeota archaeon]|nr:hypothetical protein [Candidatus Micrarchaeota archaeon]
MKEVETACTETDYKKLKSHCSYRSAEKGVLSSPASPRSQERSAFKVYLVGGAVRDRLLGRPIKERDFVVVGATPQQMERAGFQQVGKEFPVFLHPKTKEEFALARTERKRGRGYKGFVVYASPKVTLEEDLRRRDLTINAMAMDAS